MTESQDVLEFGQFGHYGRAPRPQLSYGIPTLDDFAHLHVDDPHVIAVALPWQPAGETPFVVAQAFARQGHNPLCVNPGWSPYWDGALDVHRLESSGGPIDYDRVTALARQGQPVIVDQFSQLHYDVVKTHVEREEVVVQAGRKLHSLARTTGAPVIVFTRRRTRGVVQMSGHDLRSDGGLEYLAEAVLLVEPHPRKETADLLVLKHRSGPTGAFPGVHWPNLPRTAAYRRT